MDAMLVELTKDELGIIHNALNEVYHLAAMKKIERCVHCLVELMKPPKSGMVTDTSATLDHVFPKHWFPESTPQNLNRWTVPACHKCNDELGGIEKVLLNRMALCLDLTKPELMALYRKVRRGLALNLSEEERKQIDPEELKVREADKKKVFGDVKPWDELGPEERNRCSLDSALGTPLHRSFHCRSSRKTLFGKPRRWYEGVSGSLRDWLSLHTRFRCISFTNKTYRMASGRLWRSPLKHTALALTSGCSVR